MTTDINGISYNIHPIYDLYASDVNGNIIHIFKRGDTHKGNRAHRGYLMFSVRKHGSSSYKSYQVHRFVWECFNNMIPDGMVIDHINDDKTDNRLCNLQLMSQQENCKKSAEYRDYSFVKDNHKNKRCIKVINQNTNEVTYYNSMYSIQQHLGINAGIVKMVAENLNYCKTGISRKDGHSYKFEYVEKEDLPDDCFKSPNIRPKRVSTEDKKKRQKEAIKKWG